MVKKRSRTKSVDAAIGLVLGNIDLLFEVFLRIPAKSLIRLKLVCKSWLSLISDTEFGITHSRRNSNIASVSHLYYRVICYEEVFISLHGRSSFPSMACLDPFRQNYGYDFRIAHSCNGLILFKKEGCSDHIVVNPTTQKYRLIKPSDSLCSRLPYASSECLLAFEPLKSQHYKAVIVPEFFCDPILVHIFSSHSGTWKDFTTTSSPGKWCTRKIYCNGSIHWLNENNFHMQFDVDAEKLIETPLPPKPRILGDDKIRYFGESNGRLFLIQCHRNGALGFRLLEMDMKTHSWSINQQINLRPLALQFPDMHLGRKCRIYYVVLYVKSRDDMKSLSLVLGIPGKVVLYEVKKGKSHANGKVICELSSSSFYMYQRELRGNVQPLMECLAPV